MFLLFLFVFVSKVNSTTFAKIVNTMLMLYRNLFVNGRDPCSAKIEELNKVCDSNKELHN